MGQMTATVIGAGSVGLGLAASLAQAGIAVRLMARDAQVAALNAAAFTVSGLHGAHEIAPGTIRAEDSAAPSDAARACDMLVATTKTINLAQAVAPFAGQPAPKAVLSLQNGLGSSEILRDVLGPDVPIYASAMMIGLERQGLAHVAINAAAGPILCGPLLGDDPAPLAAFVAAAQGGFLPIEVDPNIRDTIYYKLLFNTCMNPTGALTGLTYGALVENPHTLDLIARLADETLRVFGADSGYAPAPDGDSYARQMLAPAVRARSAAHRSSMVQDIDAGRRTEIDTLNGAVAALGRRHGIATPTHDAIIALIKARAPA